MQINEKQIQEIVQKVLLEVQAKQSLAQKPSVELESRNGDFKEIGQAKPAVSIKEVGIGIGPAFGISIHNTIKGLPLVNVLKELLAGIEEEGMIPRIIRVTRTSDVAFIGNDVAKMVGSGVALGIQSKGTVVIHQKDLYPLTNLELFPQAPLITLEIYRAIGKNTAKYAKGEVVTPIPIQNDINSRPRYQVKAALMHTKETEMVINRGPYIEIDTSFHREGM
ncbi:MAG TPA: propanediol/glycerol family dehydratase medium subunit [Epulopiscium sp.]|nr:propanediol/glycerol family dehydratase medium subunit [Candidatus Epulonipiscium sp.]